MGFGKDLFKQEPIAEEELPNSIPVQCAQRLEEHLQRNFSLKGTGRYAAYVKVMMKYIRKYDSAIVQKTITFLINNFREPYFPQVFDLKSFDAKFDRLKQLMEDSLDHVVPDEESEHIAYRLARDKWPGRVKASLPKLVHKSKQNLAAWLNKIADTQIRLAKRSGSAGSIPSHDNPTALKAWHMDRRIFHVLDYLCKARFFHTQFLDFWFETLRRESIHSKYLPTLDRFVFTPEHPRYARMMESAVAEWCNNPEWWFKAVEEINHEDRNVGC